MGFKIRDKSLFWTRSGWKNNWQAKILNMPRPVNSANTMFVSNRGDHHSFLRIVQSYRNYSRICKQYLYGDKMAEEAMILELRHIFKIPLISETPTDQIKHGGERRMADQLDRDYELLTHNYHPMQLYAYETRNKYIRQQNENYQIRERGQKTAEDIFEEELKNAVAQQQAKLGAGEKISLQKITQTFHRVARITRGHLKSQQTTRNQHGEFNDFLEKRRPFLNPDNERVSN